MSKKIVYIVGGLLRPDGMSQVLCQKVNYLAENTDFDVYVVLTEKAGSPLYYSLSPKIKCINFDINFDELDTMPILKKIFDYKKKIKKYKALLSDYLVSLHPDITVTAMRREINFINDIQDGSKKVGEIHFNKSNYREFNKSFLPQYVNKFITNQWRGKLIKEIKRLDKFVVLSNEDRQAWFELENVEVINNPIRYYPDSYSSCLEKRAIAVGRYTYQKGFDMLIEAWKLVNEKHPDWHLDIYGSGDNHLYQNIADSKGLSNCVICHNAVKDIYEKYRESSIFVLSSRYEGFGLVLAEAMSCGLTAVTFTCPCGPKDIVADKVDGLWVEPNNIEDLADKISYMIEDDKMRIELGRNAIGSSKRYHEDVIMWQWINLFCNLYKQGRD